MGWVVNYEEPLYLLTNPADLDELLIALRSIGIDNVVAYADADKVVAEATEVDSYKNISPVEANKLLANDNVAMLDVRNLTEYNAGNVEGSQHIMVGTLKNRLDEVPTDKKLLVLCQAGGRSAIATAILKANGFDDVLNVSGGYNNWQVEVNA